DERRSCGDQAMAAGAAIAQDAEESAGSARARGTQRGRPEAPGRHECRKEIIGYSMTLQIAAVVELVVGYALFSLALYKPSRLSKGQKKVVRAPASRWGIVLQTFG